jgi:hypothetical protein
VLFDIPSKADFAKGKALDLEQNGAILGYDASIIGSERLGRLRGRGRHDHHRGRPPQAGPEPR